MLSHFLKDSIDSQISNGNDSIFLLSLEGCIVYESKTPFQDDQGNNVVVELQKRGLCLRDFSWNSEPYNGQICDLNGKSLGDWVIKYSENSALLYCHYSVPTKENILESLHPFMAIVDLLPGNTFVKNVDGIYMAINLAMLERSDFSHRNQLIGRNDIDLWPDSAQRIIRNDQEVIEKRTCHFFIEKFTRTNGQVLYYAGHKMPIFDRAERVVGIMGNLIDITALKQKEYDLLAEKEAAVKQNRVKMDFIRNMQHDIRTPFTGIIGTANILMEKESCDHKKALLSIIHNSADELLAYCNDIIDYANIENGQVAIVDRIFNCRTLGESVFQLEVPAAQSKGIRLQYDYDDSLVDQIVGDPFRIQRILINLVSNGIKFTSTGSVKFTISKLKKIRQHRNILIKISVEDTGMGIPTTQQDQIFEKLTRVSPANKGLFKGRGFGLKIVKQFIEDLDGDLNLQSNPGKGTKVSIVLPVKEPLVQDSTV